MPLYGYECDEHGEFDTVRRMADRETAPCPICFATCERVFSRQMGGLFIPGHFHDGRPTAEQVAKV